MSPFLAELEVELPPALLTVGDGGLFNIDSRTPDPGTDFEPFPERTACSDSESHVGVPVTYQCVGLIRVADVAMLRGLPARLVLSMLSR